MEDMGSGAFSFKNHKKVRDRSYHEAPPKASFDIILKSEKIQTFF
jgi:hypothetical protein